MANETFTILWSFFVNEAPELTISPFPHTTNLQQTTLNSYTDIGKTIKMFYILYESLIIEYGLKNCGKRKTLFIMSNLSFCDNVFKKGLLQRHPKASVCGKGG